MLPPGALLEQVLKITLIDTWVILRHLAVAENRQSLPDWNLHRPNVHHAAP